MSKRIKHWYVFIEITTKVYHYQGTKIDESYDTYHCIRSDRKKVKLNAPRFRQMIREGRMENV